jgi:diadenosine tetraphosphatase ApaH/serine/threonine PP2A family protein phosphatase
MSQASNITSSSGSNALSAASNSVDFDKLLALAKAGELLREVDIQNICRQIKDLLIEESNILELRSPITVCGDIHGQFYDLLELFQVGGWPPNTSYIFMGDFVDRGMHSIETICLLLLLKCKYPQHMHLLRGNHECRQISQVYGFYDECIKKFGGSGAWKFCTDLFDYFPIGALIDGRVFCIHGGLSPTVKTLDQIRRIERAQEIPHDGAFCDLMWSDPEELENECWSLGPRGAGYLFGRKVVMEFNQINDLLLIARAHQLVQEGYKFMFPEKSLVTVWSAPNYCYRCGNIASIMRVNPDLNFDESNFVTFRETSHSPSGGGQSENDASSRFLDQRFFM